MLDESMKERGIQTHLAKGDADVFGCSDSSIFCYHACHDCHRRYRSRCAAALACSPQLVWPDLQIRKKGHATSLEYTMASECLGSTNL